MSFEAMIKDLIKKGLIDKDRKMTPKGHDYVEEIKRKHTREAAERGEEIIKSTEIGYERTGKAAGLYSKDGASG